MRRESEKICVKLLHVNLHMRHRLCSVDKYRHTVTMSHLNHILDRIHRTEHIRHVANCHHPGILREHLLVHILTQLPFLVNRHDTQTDALVLLQQLPRHNVGMMLHHRKNNLVSVTKTVAIRRRNKVDCLGSATGKDNLFSGCGIDVSTYFFTCTFLHFSSLLRQFMHPTVHIGLHRGVHLHDFINHTTRCLRSGSRIEINQRLTENLAFQYRIFRTYIIYIKHLSLLIYGTLMDTRGKTNYSPENGFRRDGANGLSKPPYAHRLSRRA